MNDVNQQAQPARASVPAVALLRLDRSKPYSECRGERTPDDPHYRVHNWQGRKVGTKIVLLPFDAQDRLVPDDGKTEPWIGLNSDGKQVTHHPLYNNDMRALADRLMKRTAAPEPDAEAEQPDEIIGESKIGDDVNLASWLRGEVRYPPHELRAAAKARYHINYSDTKEMVRGLVLDEKLVPEAEVAPHLAVFLQDKAA